MRLRILAVVAALIPTASAWALTSTSVSFQRGVNGYDSNTEIRISGDANGTGATLDGLASQRYAIDGHRIDDPETPAVEAYSADIQELIKFGQVFNNDGGPVPIGATIIDAQLTYVTGNSANDISPGAWGVAGLLQPFTTTTNYETDFPASTATNPFQRNSHGAWFEDINQTTQQPYATRPVGAFAGPNADGPPITGTNRLNGTTNADVFALVQKWSDGLPNHGMVVQAGWTGQTDGWGFFTTGNTTSPTLRPKLSVTYTTDTLTKTTIQRGLNEYDGNTYARLDSGGNLTDAGDDITTDGSTATGALYIDGATGSGGVFAALTRFTSVFGAGASQAPAEKTIAKAWLVLTTGTGDDHRSPGPFSVHKMLRDWDLTTLYTNIGATPGIQEADGDIGAALDTNHGAINGGESWFDITSYLEGIRNGATDMGLAILPNSGDGWAITANGTTDIAIRPRLVIYQESASVPVGVLGDYNNNGVVDAADYVVWKNGGPLLNESASPSVTDQADYDYWRSRFGATTGSGSGSGAIPEPTSMLLGMIAALGFLFTSSRKR